VRFAFPSIKQHISFCFHTLQEQVLRWMKPPTTSLVVGTLADLTRGKAELLAENALLRQQLIILCRQIKRPVYKKTDRLLLVLLARMVRTWKQALVLVQPETLLRLPPGAFPRVLEAQIQGALKKVEDFARDNQLDQGNGSQQSALGSRTYPWRVT